MKPFYKGYLCGWIAGVSGLLIGRDLIPWLLG